MSEVEKPKSGWKQERPWYVEFFFDPTKPVALRATIGGILLLIVLYPVISVNLTNRPPPPAKQGSSQPPAGGPNDRLTDEKPAPPPVDEPVSTPPPAIRVVHSSAAPIDPVFHQVPGLNQLFVSAFLSPDGDVWVTCSQQMYQFENAIPDARHMSVRLDPSTYDQIDELPKLTSAMAAPDGAIWAGAKDGTLFRYAEYDWKVMSSPGEPFKFAIRALVAFQNRLYIAGQGVWKWDGAKGKITRFPAFNNVMVNSFAVRRKADGREELMMAADNGVWRLSENGWVLVMAANGSDQRAQTLLDLGSEGFLVGTGDGILRVSPAGIVLERLIPGNDVTAIVRDTDGHLWVGTRSAGLKYWDNSHWFQYSMDEGFPGRNVTSILLDPNGVLWLAVFGKGLFTAPLADLKQNVLKHQDTSKTIDARQPKVYSTACKAAAEEIREGTSGAVGLFKLDGRDYTFFRGRQVCPLGAGFLAPDRTVYLLSGWNLTVAAAGSRREVEVPKEYPADQVKKLVFVDSARRVWFGPVSSGPFVLNALGAPNDPPQFQGFSEIPEFTKNPTSFILEDTSSAIWVGSAPTFDRENEQFNAPPLHRFDGAGWTHFTPKDGLASWMLQDGVLRRDGSIAIAGDNGLSLIQKGVIEKVRASDALRKRFMFSIFEDRLGDLWIGHQFFSPGVTYFDSTAFHNVTAEQGLFSDRIIAVAQDSLDRMWLLASNGTVGIYPRSFFDRKAAEDDRLPGPGSDTPAPEKEKPAGDGTEMLPPPADESIPED